MDDLVSQRGEMHFSNPIDFFDGLAPEQTARILASAADVTLVIDKDGTILDAAFGVEALFSSGGRRWGGRKLIETVTPECEGKIRQMLKEALDGKDIRPREINHSMPHGEDMPVRYSAARLDDNGNVIVFGQDISRVSVLQQRLINTQLQVEREFARLRASELRYRMMFQLSTLPQIVVEPTTLRVSDTNPAALRVLGLDERRVDNAKIADLFDSDNTELLHKLLRATLDDKSEGDIKLELRSGEVITISAKLFRQGRRNYMLLQLASDSGNVVPLSYAIDRQMLDLVESMPDAFVLANSDRKVIAVNNAFLDLLNMSHPKDVEGELLDSWFERSGVDCNVLIANVEEHGSVRRFATVLRGRYGHTESVEIAATKIEHGMGHNFGFVIRAVSTLPAAGDHQEVGLGRSNEKISNLVGHMPLKDIVKETTQMIEQLCIDTALDLTKGNRVSAAKMLGLSRQSLYAKLAQSNDDDD